MSFSSLPTSGGVGGIDPLVGSPENPMLRPHVSPIQAITKPQPTVFVPPKCYICTVANASLHRYDGTRIGFRFGFLETNVEATQQYLDTEIAAGNTYLRHAIPSEITEAKMRLDPVGTIREKVKDEIEAELRVKLEAEIREKLGMLQELNTPASQQAVNNSNADAQKLAAMDVKERQQQIQNVKVGEGARVLLNPVSTADIKTAAKGQ
jgi:hypothetical protein